MTPSSAPHPRITARDVPTLVRIQLLLLAGAAPVSAIPLFVAGAMDMSTSAVILVLPTALIAVVLMLRGSPEAVWAARGAWAGLVGVLAYDAVRMPMVWAGVWPDFIPQLGGWVLGTHQKDVVVGYTWRYLGDGAGMGLSLFVFCAVVMAVRPSLVTAHPVALSIGYGVFIWSGLMATVLVLPRGERMLFEVSGTCIVLTLVGHLIYGAVLGMYLRRAVCTEATASSLPLAGTTRRPPSSARRPYVRQGQRLRRPAENAAAPPLEVE